MLGMSRYGTMRITKTALWRPLAERDTAGIASTEQACTIIIQRKKVVIVAEPVTDALGHLDLVIEPLQFTMWTRRAKTQLQ